MPANSPAVPPLGRPSRKPNQKEKQGSLEAKQGLSKRWEGLKSKATDVKHSSKQKAAHVHSPLPYVSVDMNIHIYIYVCFTFSDHTANGEGVHLVLVLNIVSSEILPMIAMYLSFCGSDLHSKSGTPTRRLHE